MGRAVTPVLAAVVVALIAVVVAVDALVPLEVAPEGPTPAAPGPDEGAWYCAVGDTDGESELALTAVGAADATSLLRAEIFSEGEIVDARKLGAEPGTVGHATAPPETEQLGVLTVWSEAAAVVARTWEREVTDEPSGVVAGPCVASTTTSWYLAGTQTTGGSIARLEVANPFTTDAAISVQLLTAEGLEEPELLTNVGVPARTVRTIELNEFAPEREDLGAIVTTRSGRVIVEGWQSLDPGVGGISGLSLLPLATDPAERWTVPLVPAGADERWLTVANPTDEPASLSLTVHTDDGGLLAEGFEEVSVDAGSVRRLDLAGAIPEEAEHGAMSVTSENAVPVVVSLAARFADDEVERTGHVTLAGAPDADERWIVAGLPTGEERAATLQLVNPAAETAIADVRLATADGLRAPGELVGLEVAPGAVRHVALGEHVDGLAEHAVLVRSDGAPVVAGLLSHAREGELRAVGVTGTPSSVWQPQVERRPVDHDASLTRRIGTRLGPSAEPVDPEEPPEEPPTPIPTPAATPDGGEGGGQG